MKLNRILLLFILFASLIACSDDDNSRVETGAIPLSEWKGDWNDPSHPNFKPGGFNPIIGKWKLYLKNGLPVGTSIKLEYEFTSDFIFKIYSNGNYQSASDYQINDKHFLARKSDIDSGVLYQYRFKMIEGTNYLVIFDGEKTYQFSPVIE